jgi:hypothetical protein
VLLGLGALVLVGGGISAWLFLRSETGQKVMRVASEGITLARQATTAPGTKELRAAGCSQAMILPMKRLQELVGQISPEARNELPGAGSVGSDTLILCQITMVDGNGPDCAQIARVYAGAVPSAPERFAVIVQGGGRGKPKCQGLHARDGSLLTPLENE